MKSYQKGFLKYLMFWFKVLIIASLLVPVFLFAQVEEWVARYNGPENGADGGNAIAVDSFGNVYVAGYANYFPLTLYCDYLIIKYDPTGQKEWVRVFGDPGNTYEEATAIAVDRKGNVYVAGRSSKIGGPMTVKYNANGDLQWVAYSPLPALGVRGIAVDNQGNVYVGGHVIIKYDSLGQEQWVIHGGNDMEFRDGYVYVTGGFADSCLTVKYDSLGQEQWRAKYRDPTNHGTEGRALAIDQKGNVYVTGYDYVTAVNPDYITLKYDSTGQLQWVRRFNGLRDDWARDIEVDKDGNVYVTGEAYFGRPALYDYLTIKYDSAGNELWTARYTHGYDLPYGGIAVDGLGNVYVTGVSFGRNNEDYCTIKYGPNGEEQWVARYNTPRACWDYAWDIAVDKAGNVYVTGGAGGSGPSKYDCVTIKYSTYSWTKTRPMPEGPKKKKIKDGGSLVAVPESLIFAFKGNKTNEFYAFDITNQTWSQKRSLNQPVAKGASLTYGKGIIYAIRGNKTNEFFGYFVNGDSWKRLKDVPGKKLKGGTGLAYVSKGDSDLVYLLKGSKTNEFWVYYANDDTWLKRADAPTLPSKKNYKDGSCIVYDGNRTIYALKGGTNEFYAYDIIADFWTEKQTLPTIGTSGKKKKVKSGGAMVWADSMIYAFKGGNTLEFWQYLPGSNTWIEKESLLAGEKRKKIKGGGALAYIGGKVYALKGNNTLEFWVYTPKQEMPGAASKSGVVAQTQGKKEKNQISVYPNPFSKTTTLSYSLLQPCAIAVDLYDITRRLLWRMKMDTKTRNGGIAIERKGLSSGIYFLHIKSFDFQTTKKLIVNK